MTNNVCPVKFPRWNFSANNLHNIPEQEFVIQELRQDADTVEHLITHTVGRVAKAMHYEKYALLGKSYKVYENVN